MALRVQTFPEKTPVFDRGSAKSIEAALVLLSDQNESTILFKAYTELAQAIKVELGVDTHRQLAKSVALRDRLRTAVGSLPKLE